MHACREFTSKKLENVELRFHYFCITLAVQSHVTTQSRTHNALLNYLLLQSRTPSIDKAYDKYICIIAHGTSLWEYYSTTATRCHM